MLLMPLACHIGLRLDRVLRFFFWPFLDDVSLQLGLTSTATSARKILEPYSRDTPYHLSVQLAWED